MGLWIEMAFTHGMTSASVSSMISPLCLGFQWCVQGHLRGFSFWELAFMLLIHHLWLLSSIFSRTSSRTSLPQRRYLVSCKSTSVSTRGHFQDFVQPIYVHWLGYVFSRTFQGQDFTRLPASVNWLHNAATSLICKDAFKNHTSSSLQSLCGRYFSSCTLSSVLLLCVTLSDTDSSYLITSSVSVHGLVDNEVVSLTQYVYLGAWLVTIREQKKTPARSGRHDEG